MRAQKRRYGYRRIHVPLQREGWLANHKCIWRQISADRSTSDTSIASMRSASSSGEVLIQKSRST
ncbi:IS3 family transposase [Burkholderia sp. LMG 32019]|uniref:IS3 family transposase n=1 Tax=Burkholderia sp. LMG 32019 TaxID=3158173 RepID=UPI003C2C4645